jgi:hypothetical protein
MEPSLRHVVHLPRLERAYRSGSGETRMKPVNGDSISSTRNKAVATEIAQTNRAAITVAFQGANNPKLTNTMVSQNTRITRNGKGIEFSAPASTIHLACSSDSPMSTARDWRFR